MTPRAFGYVTSDDTNIGPTSLPENKRFTCSLFRQLSGNQHQQIPDSINRQHPKQFSYKLYVHPPPSIQDIYARTWQDLTLFSSILKIGMQITLDQLRKRILGYGERNRLRCNRQTNIIHNNTLATASSFDALWLHGPNPSNYFMIRGNQTKRQNQISTQILSGQVLGRS